MSTLEFPTESTDSQGEQALRRPITATDGELLVRFTRNRDQAAFAQLVDAHGPLVWSVCRQVLHRQADMEDAFQATFLILARRAADIRASDSAAGWLYRVAHRTSVALARRNKSRPEEPLNGHDFADEGDDPLELVHRQHSVAVLVEELRTLPSRYQEPLVLCYLEGHTRSRVAEMLDLTTAAVKGRLARGKRMLRHRLARRGVALSVAAGIAAATVETAKASTAGGALTASTASAATEYLTSGSATAGATPTACSLAQQGVSAMFFASLAKPALSVAVLVAMGLVAAVASDETPVPGNSGSAPLVLVAAADALEETTTDAVSGDEVQVASKKKSKSPPTTFPPKPSASAEGLEETKREDVRLEIVKSGDGKEEDIFILRGDRDSVTEAQEAIKRLQIRRESELQPPPLAAPAPRDLRVPSTHGDLEIYAPAVRSPATGHANVVWNQAGSEGPSVQELELQRLYWETRMEGLEIKSMLFEKQYKRIEALTKSDPKAVSAQELEKAGEFMGESYLMRADAYLAKAKMLEMERRIEQRKKQANVPKASFVPSPDIDPGPARVDYTQPRYAPQPQPTYRDPNAPVPAQFTPRDDVVVTPAAEPARLLWDSNIEEASRIARQSGRKILVQFTSPHSGPCVKFNQMVDGSPKIRQYIFEHAVPVKIDVSEQPEVVKEFRITRVPTVCVVHPDGDVLQRFLAPQNEAEYLNKLKAVVEEAPKPTDSLDVAEEESRFALAPLDAKPGKPSDAKPGKTVEMLLPGEVVIVKISRKKPQSREDAYSIGISESGYIGVPGANRVARIAGPLEKASEKVMAELRAFHGEYFDAMDIEVEVEPTGQLASRATLSSPMMPNLPAAADRYQSEPKVDQGELEKLKEELEALRKENEKLKKQAKEKSALSDSKIESDPPRTGTNWIPPSE